jgi:hypothetical protein
MSDERTKYSLRANASFYGDYNHEPRRQRLFQKEELLAAAMVQFTVLMDYTGLRRFCGNDNNR